MDFVHLHIATSGSEILGSSVIFVLRKTRNDRAVFDIFTENSVRHLLKRGIGTAARSISMSNFGAVSEARYQKSYQPY